MKQITLTGLMALFCLILQSSLVLAEETKELSEIEECKSQAYEYWDSGATAKMREGHMFYQQCLLDKIKQGLQLVMENKSEVDGIIKSLEAGVYSVGEASWTLQNKNKWCGPLGCGTMYQTTYYRLGHTVLEDYLHEIKQTAKEYE